MQLFTSKAVEPSPSLQRHLPARPLRPDGTGLSRRAYFVPAIYCALSLRKYIYDALTTSALPPRVSGGPAFGECIARTWDSLCHPGGMCPWVRSPQDASPLQGAPSYGLSFPVNAVRVG